MATRDSFSKKLLQPFGKKRGMSSSKARAEVFDLHFRELCFGRTLREFEETQRTLRGFEKGLDTGGRRAQNVGTAMLFGQMPNDRFRVISRRRFLLVTGLVFFIHNDETEVRKRRKKRTSRTDYDRRFARSDPQPVAQPLLRR